YFTPGEGPVLATFGGLRIGLNICEDIWHAGPACQAAAAGAELIVVTNASPFEAGKQQQREAEVRRRARDTRVPCVYVNLVGGQDELVFDGGSLAMNADGTLAARAPNFEAGLYPVDFIREGDRWRAAAGAVHTDASETESVYRAIVLGIRDYVGKNRFSGVVLGLSGGVDSALTLALAVDALGASNVTAVMMPSRYTSALSLNEARAQAETLGVEFHDISIEPAFEAFRESLHETLHADTTSITGQNIQARCRGVLLMAISNRQGRLVLTTGNKSELATGYATLYGDMAGGFAPLRDCTKSRVYALCRYRNAVAPVIPEAVIERAPSAELAPEQKDSDSLPPYEILDPILTAYVEEDLSVAEIAARGFDAATVKRVVKLVQNAEYKRRQAPPGVRVSRRAFGRDRRYPITSGYHRP
ncbi:MAG TPA: NAD+ synthase, partial [Gammaproteobacteria bacterium]|nr:NAD+ synthase [Gammaproteobacteria bacterium]